MEVALEDLWKIGLALVLGGAIGAEREYRDKSAGFRTLILICVGSCLFTLFSVSLSDRGDPGRIAAQIVSGIGFLGGGAILRHGNSVRGLTTAATIWLTASIGVGVGAGHHWLAAAATGVILLVLVLFPTIESWIDGLRHAHTYRVVVALSDAFEVPTMLEETGLDVRSITRAKHGENLVCSYFVVGTQDQHKTAVDKLLDDARVRELSY
jgi:putative Mg2+ transporter-C (MgtC) family protein